MRKSVIILFLIATLLPGGCAVYWAPELWVGTANWTFTFWHVLNIAGFASAVFFGYRIVHILLAKETEDEPRAFIFLAWAAVLGALAFLYFIYSVLSDL